MEHFVFFWGSPLSQFPHHPSNLTSFLSSSLVRRKGEEGGTLPVVQGAAASTIVSPKKRSVAEKCENATKSQGKALSFAWVLSLLVHSLGVVGGAVAVSRWTLSSPKTQSPVEVLESPEQELSLEMDLPTMQAPTTLSAPASSSLAAVPDPNGGAAVPRLDQGLHGRGGEATGQPALNLADQDDGLLLSRDLLSRMDRSQVQRLHTSKIRTSLANRRAAWEPMELTFLASGKGDRQQRRTFAEQDPSRGERFSAAPSVRGGELGAIPLPAGEGESPRFAGGTILGSDRRSPGLGIQDSRLQRASPHEGATVAWARPSVVEGRPAVPSTVVDRARDNVDSEQEVATTDPSLLHASPAGGLPGEGRGGETGPGTPGSGGDHGGGSSSRAAGRGSGSSLDVQPADPAIAAYTRAVFGKVYAVWGVAFPKDLAMQGRQGIAVIDFLILADGRAANVVLSRSSGYPEFDAIVRMAVLRSSPFPPMPAAFGVAKAWRIRFDAKNPPVR